MTFDCVIRGDTRSSVSFRLVDLSGAHKEVLRRTFLFRLSLTDGSEGKRELEHSEVGKVVLCSCSPEISRACHKTRTDNMIRKIHPV